MYVSRSLMLAALAAVVSFASLPAEASVVSAVWTDESHGSLNGVDFTVSGGTGPFWEATTWDFDEAGHSYAPLTGVDALSYGADSELVVTFDNPVTDLLLYAGSWRGSFSTFDDPAVAYTFSDPFSILSGFSFSTVAGQTITIDDDNVAFEDGILSFATAITTLTISAEGASNTSAQLLTFGVEAGDVSDAPVPAALPLMATGLGGLAFARRRRKGAAKR